MSREDVKWMAEVHLAVTIAVVGAWVLAAVVLIVLAIIKVLS